MKWSVFGACLYKRRTRLEHTLMLTQATDHEADAWGWISHFMLITGTWAQNVSGQCDAVRRVSGTLNRVWRSCSAVDHPEAKPVGVGWSKIAKNSDVCSRTFVLLRSGAMRPRSTIMRYLRCIWRVFSETNGWQSGLYYRSCPMCANTHSSGSTCTEQSTGGDVVQFQVTIC